MTQVSVAVIGAGKWGRNLVKGFHNLGALAAIVDTQPATRAEMAKQYPAARVDEDYRAIFSDPAIPAVAIATPVPTHFALVKEALLAGKDVFVEKPITMCSKEAAELTELAAQKKRVLMVGHLLLYQPAVQYIKQVIDAGCIGEVKSFHQNRLKLGRARKAEDVLWSFGVHDLAVLLYLINRPLIDVQSAAQKILQPQIADDVYLHLQFENNVQAHLHVSWLWPEVVRSLTVVGTQAMLVYDEVAQTVTFHKKGVTVPELQNRDEGSEVTFRGESEPLRLELEHFLKKIKTRETPFSDGESAVRVLKVLEAASRTSAPPTAD